LIASEAPRIAISLSSAVQPELREYDRVSTTVANAYVQPLMARYVRRLVHALDERGFRGHFHLMHSSALSPPAPPRRFRCAFSNPDRPAAAWRRPISEAALASRT
jgi:N-methylhydantoinase A/oxoprolinase/acetone carboxylase beta subunit